VNQTDPYARHLVPTQEVGPFGQRPKYRHERLAERRHLVLDARRDLAVIRARDQAVALELAQSLSGAVPVRRSEC